jgi:PncC family amidohydrolase
MEKKELLDELVGRKLTLACMESLTGGLFAATFTAIPGASKAFKGGYVTYSNDAKIKAGVRKETLDTYGAISKECAEEMALACSRTLGTDVSVSFTGNAGPEAQEDKPVGDVYLAIRVLTKLYAIKAHFSGDRAEVRNQCVELAFLTLLDKVKALPKPEEETPAEKK